MCRSQKGTCKRGISHQFFLWQNNTPRCIPHFSLCKCNGVARVFAAQGELKIAAAYFSARNFCRIYVKCRLFFWAKGTFKYHMTPRERFAQTVIVPSYVGRGFGQIVIVPSYVGRGFGQIVILLLQLLKKLNLQFILLYLRYVWGEERVWLKTSYGGGVSWKRQNTVI